MYALVVEVDANESHTEQARQILPTTAVTHAKEIGGTSGYWLAPSKSGAFSMVVFDTEEQAREAAAQLSLGPTGVVPGVNFVNIEVREILASF